MSGDREAETRRPKAREDVVFRSMADEWVLYDPRSQDLHVCNATAAAIWACCDGTLDAGGIARQLASHLQGAPSSDAVLEDVIHTLERFRADGLLE